MTPPFSRRIISRVFIYVFACKRVSSGDLHDRSATVRGASGSSGRGRGMWGERSQQSSTQAVGGIMNIVRWVERTSLRRISVPVLLCALLLADVAQAETVIARRRLGNNVEGMTYDPLNDRAVIMDGNDVIGVALNPLDTMVLATMRNETGQSRQRVPEAVRRARLAARGASAERHRVRPHPAPVLLHQRRGGRDRRALQHRRRGSRRASAGAPEPESAGGLLGGYRLDPHRVRLPTAACWPCSGPGTRRTPISHLYFVRLDGTVEQELIPQAGTPLETYFCGWRIAHASFDAPAHRLLQRDLRHGSPERCPVGRSRSRPSRIRPDSEGLIVRRDGSVLAVGYQEGRLFAYDPKLKRTPRDDKLFVVGIGASVSSLAWNFDPASSSRSPRSAIGCSRSRATSRNSRRLFDVAVTNEVQWHGASPIWARTSSGSRAASPAGSTSPRWSPMIGTTRTGGASRASSSRGTRFPPGKAFIPPRASAC